VCSFLILLPAHLLLTAYSSTHLLLTTTTSSFLLRYLINILLALKFVPNPTLIEDPLYGLLAYFGILAFIISFMTAVFLILKKLIGDKSVYLFGD